ncbi:aspartyl protease family protein At5g10770-like isoform X1 [Panicum virgatum]|uniref:Peptidase A1 domain-containing protein n=1 Tax=Panicum virgatum TaxID=38727 RepID=A0A8T0TJA2_PANVG|nr:aspartyl protease family protein At5g10770-like isoform X1 [Panicum virgatum]KAG2609024.1 hypothetical protein PVAP13_4KG166100 [Panicum virgatum]
MSSLKPHAAYSGQVMPRGSRTWAPLYRHPGLRSPPSFTGAAAKATAPSLADLLRQDQLRVDHIHWRLSESEGGVGVPMGSVKEPVRFGVAYLHDQPVIRVRLGSEYKSSEQQSSPGVVQTVVLDTASDVPWVQCAPCPAPPCHRQADSTYDPARSGTYAAVPCGSPACEQLGRLYAGGCANGQCQYRVPFPNSNRSSSSGTYGADFLAVGPDSGITFKFGCSHGESDDQGGSSSSNSDNTTAGVMALGGGPESLVSQAAANYGNAFSYCIPAATERRQPGFFVLGGAPPSSAYVATPMLRYQRVRTFYRVCLQGIAVNGQLLNVSPSVFAAGAVLDSRTAVTRLPPTAYGALSEAFRGWMAAYTAAPPKAGLDTCYDFGGAFFVAPPRVELVLERGNVLELDRSGVLFHNCLAFAPNSDDRMPGILGNVQQQTMEVLYDVAGGAVGFRRGAC